VIVFGTKQFGSEAREMHDTPEPIASARKVVASRCCANTRVYPAEDDGQFWFKDVRK
jgi:hypothetical protein